MRLPLSLYIFSLLISRKYCIEGENDYLKCTKTRKAWFTHSFAYLMTEPDKLLQHVY